MDIYAIILKDALMVDVYDSEKSLILLDLSDLEEILYNVSLSHEHNVDTTLLINALLPLLSNRFMMTDSVAKFLSEEFVIVNKEFEPFKPGIRIAKLKRLASMLGNIRTISHTLHHLFIENNLYNRSGVLKLNTIEVEMLNAAIGSIGNKEWTPNSMKVQSYSISGTPLEYLRRILSSY